MKHPYSCEHYRACELNVVEFDSNKITIMGVPSNLKN